MKVNKFENILIKKNIKGSVLCLCIDIEIKKKIFKVAKILGDVNDSKN